MASLSIHRSRIHRWPIRASFGFGVPTSAARRSLSGGPQAPCQTEAPKGETVQTTPVTHRQHSLGHTTHTLRPSSRPQVNGRPLAYAVHDPSSAGNGRPQVTPWSTQTTLAPHRTSQTQPANFPQMQSSTRTNR